MINSNSKKAYRQMKDDGLINKQEHKIIKHLKKIKIPRTSREISNDINVERSSVCGRVNRLKDINVVIVSKNASCETTGKTVEYYKLATIKKNKDD